jgi:aspartate oxidase
LKPDRVSAEGLGLTASVTAAPVALSPQPALSSDAVRDLMWRSVGLFRTRARLADAADALERSSVAPAPSTADQWRHHNLLTVARLIARAALRREESRGGHYREDFPLRNDQQWRIHVVDEGRQGEQRPRR